MLRPYRLFAEIPHASGLMASSLLARVHIPAITIVLTFLIADWSGSYAAGGAVGGALTVGQAVAGPVRGRAADRSSAPKLLVLTGIGFGIGLLLITVLVMPGGLLPPTYWWSVLPVALLTGLAYPPVTQIGRAMWSHLAEGPAREAAYAVEATLQELLFVVGPMLFAFIIAVRGPAEAGVLCAVWSAVGTVVFAFVLRRAGVRQPAREQGHSRVRAGSLFAAPGFARMLGFGMVLVAGLVSTDLLIIGWARNLGTPQLAGVLAAVWAIGSLSGGLLLGASVKPPRLWLRAVLVATGLAALVPALPPISDPASPWLVGVILLLGGMAIAPTLASCNARLAEVTPESRRAEAFGWFSSATTAGIALASPLAGSLLDVAGPAAVATFSAALAVVAVFLVAHREVRDSRSGATIEDTVAT